MRASLVAFVALAAACGTPGDEPRATGGDEATEPRPVAEAPAAPEIALDPASPCGRALACCEAYAAAMPNVVAESACAGPREAMESPDPDARCRAMAAGWRETLRVMPDVEPPASCDP